MDEYLKHSLDYTLGEIRDNAGKHYWMANEELADEMMPHIRAVYPHAVMIKHDIFQYIAVSEREKEDLVATFRGFIKESYDKIDHFQTAIIGIEQGEEQRRAKKKAEKDHQPER